VATTSLKSNQLSERSHGAKLERLPAREVRNVDELAEKSICHDGLSNITKQFANFLEWHC
jgi:hypothetical protein